MQKETKEKKHRKPLLNTKRLLEESMVLNGMLCLACNQEVEDTPSMPPNFPVYCDECREAA